MHFFGFGTKAARSEGRDAGQVPSRQLSLVFWYEYQQPLKRHPLVAKASPRAGSDRTDTSSVRSPHLTRFAATPMPVLRLLAGRHTTEHARFWLQSLQV